MRQQDIPVNTQSLNTAIERRIVKWQGILTVDFEKLFPNLRGTKVLIDKQNFLAKCPVCSLFYSITEPRRNFSLYKRNFIDHLKRGHLNLRSHRVVNSPQLPLSVAQQSSLTQRRRNIVRPQPRTIQTRAASRRTM